MKIFFMPTLNAPVVHYRMVNFVNQLRKMGHEVAFSYWSPDYKGTCTWEDSVKPDGKTTEFIMELEDISKMAEVTVFQIIHTRAALSLFLALQEFQSKKSFLTELDDDIYTVGSDSLSFKNIGPGSDAETFADEQIIKSHGLIVSTKYLKNKYKDKNDKINIIPNCIDFSSWDNLNGPKEKKKKDIIKIGWHGGAQHTNNLRLIKNVIKRILDKYPNVVFHFKYGGYPINYLKHDRIIFEDYQGWVGIDKWAQTLKDAQFDIALAPLRDTEANRCKSNLRWLENSALKTPLVASNVEAYNTIKNNKTGFLVNEEDEWVDRLSELIEKEELRKHIGESAYNEVKNKFNVEKVAKEYEKTLKKFVS